MSALLADLAAATAVFPQDATQLGDILNRAKHDFRLEMDSVAPGEDPARVVETARLHLGAIRGPALDLYRLLDAAHNDTAHIASTVRPVQRHRADPRDSSSRPRPEDRLLRAPPGQGLTFQGESRTSQRIHLARIWHGSSCHRPLSKHHCRSERYRLGGGGGI